MVDWGVILDDAAKAAGKEAAAFGLARFWETLAATGGDPDIRDRDPRPQQ